MGSISEKRYLLAVCHIMIYDVKCMQGPAKAPVKAPVQHWPSHDFQGRTKETLHFSEKEDPTL